MHLDVNLFEAIWLALTATTLIFTVSALTEARADRAAVKLLNGDARELAADGLVRREFLRLIVQVLLLLIIIPGLFLPGETPINIYVVVVVTVPVILLVSSMMDSRDRKKMTILVAASLLHTNTDAFARIEEALKENTEISREASINAKEAYHEANSVNEKIATQGLALVAQGEELAHQRGKDDAAAEKIAVVIDDTHEKVGDLHDALPAHGDLQKT